MISRSGPRSESKTGMHTRSARLGLREWTEGGPGGRLYRRDRRQLLTCIGCALRLAGAFAIPHRGRLAQRR